MSSSQGMYFAKFRNAETFRLECSSISPMDFRNYAMEVLIVFNIVICRASANFQTEYRIRKFVDGINQV